jgi:hypothetical protein
MRKPKESPISNPPPPILPPKPGQPPPTEPSQGEDDTAAKLAEYKRTHGHAGHS